MHFASHFSFDCPACAARLRIAARQRGSLITCKRCGVQLPGPDFRASRLDLGPPPRDHAYGFNCPHCRENLHGRESTLGRPVRCPACGFKSRQPPPEWERWRRPVAKIFTGLDRRRSLHHLMLCAARAAVADELLTRREQRRFEFYCGGCGHLQEARVWDIAAQQRCRLCNTLMIIPAPRRPNAAHLAVSEGWLARHWPETAAAAHLASGLYCPQCGQLIPGADRTRRQRAHCPACNLWF